MKLVTRAVLLAALAGCRSEPRSTVGDASPGSDAHATSLVETYAPLLSEVAIRAADVDRRASLAEGGSRDAPGDDGVRVVSPAVGTPLAAHPDVLEVAVGETDRVKFRSLHGGSPSGVPTIGIGDALLRGDDTVVAMCPSAFRDEEDAVDLHLFRNGGHAIHVVATVRGPGVCPPAALARRDVAVRRAREAVGADEAALLSYVETSLRACDAMLDAGAELPPFPQAERLRVVQLERQCHRGDAYGRWGTPAVWSASPPPTGGESLDKSSRFGGLFEAQGERPRAPSAENRGTAGRWKWFAKAVDTGYHPRAARRFATGEDGPFRAIFAHGSSESGSEVDIALFVAREPPDAR